MDNLSKDAQQILCVCYNKYLEKRKNGLNKLEAMEVGSSNYIHENLLPHINADDIYFEAYELKKSGLFQINILGDIEFTNQGIIYMEQLPSKKIMEIIDLISKFIP